MGTLFFFAVNTFNRLRIDQIYEVIGIDLLTHSSKETIKQQQGQTDAIENSRKIVLGKNTAPVVPTKQQIQSPKPGT